MTVSINEIKSGLTILIDGQIYSVVDYQHVKPGKGAAFVRTKLRNFKTGAVLERTFRGDEKIEDAFIEERRLVYLYRADELYYFMDQHNFEQVSLAGETLGENRKFLKDNLEISAYFYNGQALNISLPTFIELKVTQSEPGLRGDTVKGAFKTATLETGATIQVPLFIDVGDTIKVDTRTGEYMERV